MQYTNEDVKKIMASTQEILINEMNVGTVIDQGELGKGFFECTSCKIGLNATIGGVLAACAVLAAPEEGMIVAVMAATGLGEVVVAGILAALCAGGAIAVEEAIAELCKAMGAC